MVRADDAMRELVTFIATALVDRPEEVSVTESEENGATVLSLRVAKEDLGKVIGKQGRTARAMRTLIGTLAGRERRSVRLEIVE